MNAEKPEDSTSEFPFDAIAHVSSSLNRASNELSSSVSALNLKLRKLNLGITSWIEFDQRAPLTVDWYDHDEIGYAKVGGLWTIALRHVAGTDEEPIVDGPWPFGDAPREMRLRSVEHIPKLLSALVQDARQTTARVNEGLKVLTGINKALDNLVEEKTAASRGGKS